MTNLDYLFAADRTFHDAVVVLAAAAIGTTNPAFAEEWLQVEVDDAQRVQQEAGEGSGR